MIVSITTPKLLLFDIDGTLLDTGGAGFRSLKLGFQKCFPFSKQREFPPLDLGGATDGSVADFLFTEFEIEKTAENLDRFFSIYHEILKEELQKSVENTPLPGTRPLLDLLIGIPGITLGLLTGNISRGAFTKVEHFGFRGLFEFGAFGDDHPDRNQLGPIGIERARQHSGIEFRPENVYIIGDTPKDIACARACGAVAVAVATGHSDRDTLAKSKPDFLFSCLDREQDAFFEMLTAGD